MRSEAPGGFRVHFVTTERREHHRARRGRRPAPARAIAICASLRALARSLRGHHGPRPERRPPRRRRRLRRSADAGDWHRSRHLANAPPRARRRTRRATAEGMREERFLRRRSGPRVDRSRRRKRIDRGFVARAGERERCRATHPVADARGRARKHWRRHELSGEVRTHVSAVRVIGENPHGSEARIEVAAHDRSWVERQKERVDRLRIGKRSKTRDTSHARLRIVGDQERACSLDAHVCLERPLRDRRFAAAGDQLPDGLRRRPGLCTRDARPAHAEPDEPRFPSEASALRAVRGHRAVSITHDRTGAPCDIAPSVGRSGHTTAAASCGEPVLRALKPRAIQPIAACQ